MVGVLVIACIDFSNQICKLRIVFRATRLLVQGFKSWNSIAHPMLFRDRDASGIIKCANRQPDERIVAIGKDQRRAASAAKSAIDQV